MIDVNFEHWRLALPDALLVRYGSPHFDPSTAGKELAKYAIGQVSKISSHSTNFHNEQILCANEAFPEAAVADPLADLDVWDEWRSGIRCFPYPGRFSRLGITSQEGKTSSPSSVGVLGEIMAGLYSQAAISPWIIVRVIRRWPDFIFYLSMSDKYAFVESKAFIWEASHKSGIENRVQDKLLSECLVNAVHQLNADPFVCVWGAFTAIANIDPMKLLVTFLEMDSPEQRRTSVSSRYLPEAVVRGIAEQAISRAAYYADPQDLLLLNVKRQSAGRFGRIEAERKLIDIADRQVEGLLAEAGPQQAISASREQVRKEIRKYVEKASAPYKVEGFRTLEARRKSAANVLTKVRTVGIHDLFVCDLDENGVSEVTRSWKSSWESANKPLKTQDGIHLWRCGGTLFGLGDRSYEGTSL